MIQRFLRVLVCLLSFPLFTASLTAQAFKVIQPPGYTPGDAAYSPGLLANGTLYVSGQGSRTPSQALGKVQGILRSAGMDFGSVVWINIYLTDAHNMAALEEVYWKMIGASPPARTVLTVAALPDGEMIESTASLLPIPAIAKPSGRQVGRKGPIRIRQLSRLVNSYTYPHKGEIRNPISPQRQNRLSTT